MQGQTGGYSTGYFSSCYDKIPGKDNLRKKGFILIQPLEVQVVVTGEVTVVRT